MRITSSRPAWTSTLLPVWPSTNYPPRKSPLCVEKRDPPFEPLLQKEDWKLLGPAWQLVPVVPAVWEVSAGGWLASRRLEPA